ncbi:hypothetical protein FHR32_003629 [Streptosporangium album]|uniref:Uncharacterized protein n=1 Tax=Streptosporangium album TaxID=47479 RepID=A0A7W7RW36_9ACTN|nr:hypothetical protein [Streptosporangium album]MBB4939324.1 hypothetical protein [Streptosporangium album]
MRRLRVQAVVLVMIGLFWTITAALTWVIKDISFAWLLTPVVGTAAARTTRRVLPAAQDLAA